MNSEGVKEKEKERQKERERERYIYRVVSLPGRFGNSSIYIYRDAYSYEERFCQPPDSCVTRLGTGARVLSYIVSYVGHK